MNRSEGAKKVEPPQKNSLDPQLQGRIVEEEMLENFISNSIVLKIKWAIKGWLNGLIGRIHFQNNLGVEIRF